MKTISLLLISMTLTAAVAAQTSKDSATSKPIQVSFIYPIALYGTASETQKNFLSFNIFYGVNGGLSGFEFGGIANKNIGDVNGFQIAGIANNNLASANGVLIAGLSNSVADSAYGIAIAGLSNRFGQTSGGIQIAGLANSVEGGFTGMQAAGLRNKTKGSFLGLQVAGLSNFNAGHFNGVQVSGISNITTGNLQGIQAGLINRAKKVGGLQIGLLNFADEYEFGTPIGLLSIVKNGFNTLDLSYNESVNYNANLKLGVDHFYNIFKFGYMPKPHGEYFSYGLGVGSMVNLTQRFKISIDLSTSYISEKKFTPTIDFLTEGQLSLRYHILENIGLFAGPSFNAYFGEYDSEGNTLLYVAKPLYDENWWGNEGTTKLWIGYNLGVSVMF